jgi:putative sterol carrier protein
VEEVTGGTVNEEIDSFFASLPERASGKDLGGIDATYVFALESGEAWTVKIADGALSVSEGRDESANCTVSTGADTFSKLVRGEIEALPAYLSGKLKLSGDLGAAMQLQKLL